MNEKKIMISNPHTGKEEELLLYDNDWITTPEGVFAVKHIIYSSLHIYTIGLGGDGEPYVISYREKKDGELV